MRLRLVLGLLVPVLMASTCNRELPVELPGLSAIRVSDEELIAGVLADVHRGMQQQRIYKVLAHVSNSYSDGEGRQYSDMQQYLSEIFQNYREIRITRGRPIITVDGNTAMAVETFGTNAEPSTQSSFGPVSLQGQVTVYLEKIGNNWKITEWGALQ